MKYKDELSQLRQMQFILEDMEILRMEIKVQQIMDQNGIENNLKKYQEELRIKKEKFLKLKDKFCGIV